MSTPAPEHDWRVGFRAAVRAWIADKPLTPVSISNPRWAGHGAGRLPDGTEYDVNFYGWKDYTLGNHFRDLGERGVGGGTGAGCSWDLDTDGVTFREHRNSEFTDTYNDPSETVLLLIEGISCQCGEITNAVAAWEGTFGDAVAGVLAAAAFGEG